MAMRITQAVVGAMALGMLASCSSETSTGRGGCDPGSRKDCIGEERCVGEQTCSADRTWAACVCDGEGGGGGGSDAGGARSTGGARTGGASHGGETASDTGGHDTSGGTAGGGPTTGGTGGAEAPGGATSGGRDERTGGAAGAATGAGGTGGELPTGGTGGGTGGDHPTGGTGGITPSGGAGGAEPTGGVSSGGGPSGGSGGSSTGGETTGGTSTGGTSTGGETTGGTSTGGTSTGGESMGGTEGCVTGQIAASEVILMGDSFYAISPQRIQQRLEENARNASALEAGESYRNVATSGQPFGIVAEEYDAALLGGPVKVVVMNGGAVDCMSDSCPSCPGMFEALLAEMAAGGVEDVIYTRYPEPGIPPGSSTSLKDRLDTLMPLMEQVCAAATGLRCHWVDLRPVWQNGDTDDGAHPNESGGEHCGDAIWARMVEECMAQ